MRSHIKVISALSFGALIITSCQKKADDSTTTSRALYIASGQCNSGVGITTYTSQNSSRMISKVDLSSGQQSIFFDFQQSFSGNSTMAPETSPQSMVDDGSNILMLTENATNTGDRRIFTVPKASYYGTSVYANDSNAFTTTAAHIERALAKDADGTVLFSKSIAIEKLGTNTVRIPQTSGATANPWVNSPAAPCGTASTLISSMVVLPPYSPATTGKLIFAHTGNTAALNRLAIISQDGYNATGPTGCIDGFQVTSVTHTYASNVTGPAITFDAAKGVNITSMVYISTGTGTGKLITSYSTANNADLNNSTNQNFAIVAWDVNESSTSAATITNPVIMYRDYATIYGISAMAYDSQTGNLYVATASQPGVANQTTNGYGYKVEKFSLDISNTADPKLTLIQVSNKPFVDRSAATKCITSMIVADY